MTSETPETIIQLSRQFLKAYYENQCALYQKRLEGLQLIDWPRMEQMLSHELQGVDGEDRIGAALAWIEAVLND